MPCVKRRDRPPKTRSLLQPDSGRGHLGQGLLPLRLPEGLRTQPRRYFEQARQLLPNSSRIPESLGPYVARRRRPVGQGELLQRGRSGLDPRSVSLLHPARAFLYRPSSFPPTRCESLDPGVLNIVPGRRRPLLARKANIAQGQGDPSRARRRCSLRCTRTRDDPQPTGDTSLPGHSGTPPGHR